MDDNLEIYRQLTVDPDESPVDVREIKAIIESLLFTAGEPLSIEDISDAVEISKKSVRKLISEMIDEFNFDRRGIQIITFNQKYQLGTRPEHAVFIRRLLKSQSKQSLSKAAVETAAIIAYKQPITRLGVDQIRGVKCDRIISNLVEKKLIREVGRMDAPGKPILYGTTDEFLKYFGLRNLDELPKLESFNPEA
jgi:segregation and condensation protein B